MNTILILIVALLPAVVLWGYVWKKDPQKEPTGQLVKAVLWGVGVCVPVALVEVGIEAMMFGPEGKPATLIDTTAVAFFVAALPEEAFKLLALWLVLRKNPYFDEHFDGIVYAVSVGLGFAAFENILYVFNEEEWMSVAITRALLAVPGHYAFAVLMGFYYAQYHFVKRSFLNGVSILAVPVIAHGIYDSIVMNVGISDYLVLPIIVLLIVFCIWMHKKCKKKIMAQLALDKAGEISA